MFNFLLINSILKYIVLKFNFCPFIISIKQYVFLFWSVLVLYPVILLSFVQLLSPVRLFVTPWTAARQASLSITNTQSLFKLMSIESVMLSNHLILCHPLLLPPSIFPNIRVFSSESALLIGGQSIGVSASA